MAGTMKAAVKSKASPRSTEIRSVPIPEPGPAEVLIRVEVSSICGTDVHIFDWVKDNWGINPLGNIAIATDIENIIGGSSVNTEPAAGAMLSTTPVNLRNP